MSTGYSDLNKLKKTRPIYTFVQLTIQFGAIVMIEKVQLIRNKSCKGRHRCSTHPAEKNSPNFRTR